LRRGPKGFHVLKRALLKASQNNLPRCWIQKTVSPLTTKKSYPRLDFFSSTPQRKDRKTLTCSTSTVSRYNLDNFSKLYLTALPHQDEIMVRIRHFSESNGFQFPTKKGVIFPLPRWLKIWMPPGWEWGISTTP
jgi:hypothetical protein